MIKEAIKHYLEANSFTEFAPRVVLFDMDGVLYNSMPNHAVAWQEAMSQFGIHFTADDSYATEGARGVDTIRHYVRIQQGKEITPEEAQRCMTSRRRFSIVCRWLKSSPVSFRLCRR